MQLPPETRSELLASLEPDEKYAALYNWDFWARPEQRYPAGNWAYWLILAGRGAGKTRTGAETVRRWVFQDGLRYVNLIAATESDITKVMIEGESGILEVCPYYERPRYIESKHKLIWPNGAVSLTFSAEKPNRLRGPQHEALWCDELAAWSYPAAWDMAQFGLRLGEHPRAIITTTPRPTKVIRDLVKDPGTVRTGGSTYENRLNLAKTFYEQIVAKYQGTRLGRQELDAEILDDVPGALWSRAMIDKAREPRAIPEMSRVVVAVDPSGTKGEEDERSDEVGIVVVGKGVDGRAYVLADRTCKLSPAAWATRVRNAYHEFKADRVVAEINYGGAMVTEVIRAGDPNIPVVVVTASRGKIQRAEPASRLYERGVVSHVGNDRDRTAFDSNDLRFLEDQLCQMTPSGFLGERSPDRADALVWALTDLMLSEIEPINVSDSFMHEFFQKTAAMGRGY